MLRFKSIVNEADKQNLFKNKKNLLLSTLAKQTESETVEMKLNNDEIVYPVVNRKKK